MNRELKLNSEHLFKLASLQINVISGGCSLVNWLSQIRRNMAIEYLNLNFVTTLYVILCGKSFYFVRLAHSYFASAYHVQAFSIAIF